MTIAYAPDAPPSWYITGSWERQSVARAAKLLHEHLHTQCRPGSHLPSDRTLAAALDVAQDSVFRARRRLETEGLLAGRRILGPTELHPADVALDVCVRDSVQAGYYQPGSALPTGFLAHDFLLSSSEVRRACHRLIADGTLRIQDEPYGPGLYISDAAGAAPC
ncbi:GntR family transcriptional regulator [Streptomyces sp. NPDC051561]|uniref:GntR family transcriptional regulator n=1 Tax=Streptomyces sp. NPDC051561 TaxID=3365658 RepID=UPI00379BACEB